MLRISRELSCDVLQLQKDNGRRTTNLC